MSMCIAYIQSDVLIMTSFLHILLNNQFKDLVCHVFSCLKRLLKPKIASANLLDKFWLERYPSALIIRLIIDLKKLLSRD